MSLDQESAPHPDVPVSLSPAPISLSEQSRLTKNRPPICSKNGLQAPSTTPPPPAATQRIGKRRFSMGISFRGVVKRRRRANSDSQAEPVLPSHFLLGGNIFDPLNLNSLLNEDVNRATNQETPKCSPMPSRSRDPVEILVPRDITDPLNLKGGGEDGGPAGVLLSPLKSRRKHRYKHHGGGGASADQGATRLFPPTAGTSGVTATGGSVCASPLSCELNTAITCREDLAPSPRPSRRHTHPPPGSAHKPGGPADCRHRRRHRTTSVHSDANHVTVATATSRFQTPLMEGAKAGRCGGAPRGSAQPSERRKDKHRYQHGNHSRYYGYHGFYGGRYGRVGGEEDPRLRLLDADWFRDKTVLDVGCGAGHMTLTVARKFNPSHILGVELDKSLVLAAKQNIRHFLSHDMAVALRSGEGDSGGLPPFPLSFRVSRGPICGPSLLPLPSASSRFPHNVTFIQGDYIAIQEAWPGRGQYDVILCLGLTKWVHLHSGDEGVVRLFKRTYQSLSPGGMFILEPQPWSSYSRSKRATESTFRRFRSLRIRPEHFTSILTDSVGFSSYRLLTHTDNKRPVYLFHKGPAQRK